MAASMSAWGVLAGSTKSAMPVAANAPIKSWPSAPIFQRRIRKAMETPSPARINGVALMVVSDQP